MANTKPIYFEGIDALRFFAATLVVIHHSEGIKAKYGFSNLSFSSFFSLGSLAVSFFFVLSGFLISYLLLVEQEKNRTINIRNFYLRRALRIWPVYFLMVILGLYLVPSSLQLIHFDYSLPYRTGTVLPYFISFVPFVVNIKFGHHLLEPLWSIGVEEMFYLMWAPFFWLFNKNILKAIVVFLILKIGLNTFALAFAEGELWGDIVLTLKFEEMAIGGSFACFLKMNYEKLKTLFYSKTLQYLTFSVLIARCLFHSQLIQLSWYGTIFENQYLSGLVVALFFGILILNVSSNTKSLIKLKNKQLNKLGEYSYGIYMYHMLIVFALVLCFKLISPSWSGYLFHTTYYLVVLSVVVLLAMLSKRYFEDPFLKLKKYFNY